MTSVTWTLVGLTVSIAAASVLWLFRPAFGRRAAWLIIGCIGFPAAAISSLYFVGVPIMLATATSGYFLRRRKMWPYFVAAGFGVLLLTAMIWSAVSWVTVDDSHPDDPDVAVAMSISIVAALAASAKLGEMAA
jgi:hypothetical protein